MTVRIIQANDPHVSDRAPAWRTETYLDDVFAKLEWVLSQPCDVVIIPGDLFHNPAPTRVSHALVQRWLRALDRAVAPVLVVAGNHDLSAGRIDSLSRQPLGVVCTHPKVVLLSGPGTIWSVEGTMVAGWGWGTDIQTIRNDCAQYKPDIAVLHASISPIPFPFGDRVDPLSLSGIAPLVCYGHIHTPELPFRAGDTTFVNPGALARGSLTAEDLERVPQIAVIDIDEKQTKVHYQPIQVARMGRDVFRAEEAAAHRADESAVTRFVEMLGEATIETVTPESLMAQVEAIAGDAAVAERARSILMEVTG